MDTNRLERGVGIASMGGSGRLLLRP